MEVLTKGISKRHTGETRTNAASSRSHCVFTCIVESCAVEDGISSFRTSRLHLVDLAGSPEHTPQHMSMICQEVRPALWQHMNSAVELTEKPKKVQEVITSYSSSRAWRRRGILFV